MPDSSPAEPLPLQRCSDLWFSDCGLIIRAEHVLFRLSREMLAARSPVFADMLSFAQPDDAELLDGCPVVSLPDPPDELRVFFRALFDHEFFEPSPAKTEFAVVHGVLRMSHKYQVDSLRKRALVHLESAFPRLDADLANKSTWSRETSHLSRTIPLCYEVSALWILPNVFFNYCRLFDLKTIAVGYSFDGLNICLPPSQQRAALSGCHALHTRISSKYLDFLWNPEELPGCSSPLQCFRSRAHGRRLAEGRRLETSYPLWASCDNATMDVCDRCRGELNKGLHNADAELYRSLPHIFGLPDWATLDAMRVEALA
ncbi:hypothetical protein B0H15DRAFT_914117 [Mycena belliarum]|uniref:BTB domain-containing protein n=1 Tax=Mycena belliarum TaxID=1033014 RepID=A0AAD6TU75_9AGAR|nr:hypothetical protein B0H15DRAFT_914117 [Mycena belliae]